MQKLLALVKVDNVVEEAARMDKESDKTMEEKRKEAAEKVEIVEIVEIVAAVKEVDDANGKLFTPANWVLGSRP